jgi:hypothetical protein
MYSKTQLPTRSLCRRTSTDGPTTRTFAEDMRIRSPPQNVELGLVGASYDYPRHNIRSRSRKKYEGLILPEDSRPSLAEENRVRPLRISILTDSANLAVFHLEYLA